MIFESMQDTANIDPLSQMVCEIKIKSWKVEIKQALLEFFNIKKKADMKRKF